MEKFVELPLQDKSTVMINPMQVTAIRGGQLVGGGAIVFVSGGQMYKTTLTVKEVMKLLSKKDGK